jgi:hypothetical protein
MVVLVTFLAFESKVENIKNKYGPEGEAYIHNMHVFQTFHFFFPMANMSYKN